MSIKIPRPVLFFLAYSIAFALYWPAMNGTPIWDDMLFWFADPVMYEGTSYGTIIKNFAWPVSVSIQKFLISIWGSKYLNYHLLNLFLHFVNAFLVYRIGRWLKIRYSFFLFALFLLHPAAVISTAWMIQIKTLLCFLFAAVSIHFYLKGLKKPWWLLASWVFFSFSLFSKSASLVLLPVFIYISYRQSKFKRMYITLPFILVGMWSAYRVVKSPVTAEAAAKVEKVAALKLEDKPVPDIVPVPPKAAPKTELKKPLKKIVEKKSKPKKEIPPVAKVEPTPVPKVEPKAPAPVPTQAAQEKKIFKFDIGLVAQSMNYYFWQALIPINNEPIKGLNYEKAGFTELIHIFFLIIITITIWKSSALFLIIVGHLLLVPFLGFVNAPYMSITWVSDQHLYLALPLFIGFWLKILENWKFKFKVILPIIFLIGFCFKTYESVGFYKNQFVFYEKSLEYNPYNIPIAYNLAYSRIVSGQWALGYNLLVDTYTLAEKEPVMKNSYFYPYFIELYTAVKRAVDKHAY